MESHWTIEFASIYDDSKCRGYLMSRKSRFELCDFGIKGVGKIYWKRDRSGGSRADTFLQTVNHRAETFYDQKNHGAQGYFPFENHGTYFFWNPRNHGVKTFFESKMTGHIFFCLVFYFLVFNISYTYLSISSHSIFPCMNPYFIYNNSLY